jgi:hypothetical protein
MTTIQKATENLGKDVHAQTEKINESMDNAKQQLISYGNQIQEYLGEIDAKIDTYKFSIEKHDEGLTVDIVFRATVQPKA